MKILSVNAGSSSLKFKLFNMPEEEMLVYGYIDKLGPNADVKVIINNKITQTEKSLYSHEEAVKCLIDILLENKIINNLEDINAIGHRIVNGAGRYQPEIIDDNIIKRLENITILSKVHMPGHIAGIKAFKKLLPNTKQVTVYDTAFHHTISKENYLYPVPIEWYKKYGVRKFGFHGISCQYITNQMEKILNKKPNLIICHIGNGASVTAVEEGKSIDNSMGFTANCGLMMGTRCGDIDYSILPYIIKMEKKNIDEIDEILNKNSGLKGITGVSDNRDLEELIKENNELAITANNMYINKIIDHIAKYYLKLYNIDALVLCGGVGENAINFRKELIEKLKKLDIHLDDNANNNISKFSKTSTGIITTKESKIPCYVIPTDEELMIAKDTYELLK